MSKRTGGLYDPNRECILLDDYNGAIKCWIDSSSEAYLKAGFFCSCKHVVVVNVNIHHFEVFDRPSRSVFYWLDSGKESFSIYPYKDNWQLDMLTTKSEAELVAEFGPVSIETITDRIELARQLKLPFDPEAHCIFSIFRVNQIQCNGLGSRIDMDIKPSNFGLQPADQL